MRPARAGARRFTNIGEFRELVIAAFRRQPSVGAIVPDSADPAKLGVMIGEASWTIDVTNVYGHVVACPDEDVEVAINRIVRGAIEGHSKSVSDDAVVAVIRTRKYFDVAKEKGVDILSEALGADLMILYMADRPDSMAPITQKDRPGEDLVRLRNVALGHVRQWLPKVVSDSQLQSGVLYYVEGNTMLSPSLILLDEFWKSVETRFPGDVLVALPRRDQLFVFDDGSVEAKARARQLIDVTIRENFNLLSPKLYARRNNRIVDVAD